MPRSACARLSRACSQTREQGEIAWCDYEILYQIVEKEEVSDGQSPSESRSMPRNCCTDPVEQNGQFASILRNPQDLRNSRIAIIEPDFVNSGLPKILGNKQMIGLDGF